MGMVGSFSCLLFGGGIYAFAKVPTPTFTITVINAPVIDLRKILKIMADIESQCLQDRKFEEGPVLMIWAGFKVDLRYFRCQI
jgi:hypothetical protein